ncbi:MAG: serine hydrolase [Lachnospiraceae bacterium]|nr:serine hydrolase [Lachnospiraceae bacterium]
MKILKKMTMLLYLLLMLCTLAGCSTIPASPPSAEVSEGHDSNALSDEPSSDSLPEAEKEMATDDPHLEAVDSLPEGSWQAEKAFPDQAGDVDKALAMNSMYMVNSYAPDGSRISDGSPVTNDTLYDLASNTKMYAAVYAIQYLIDRGEKE